MLGNSYCAQLGYRDQAGPYASRDRSRAAVRTCAPCASRRNSLSAWRGGSSLLPALISRAGNRSANYPWRTTRLSPMPGNVHRRGGHDRGAANRGAGPSYRSRRNPGTSARRASCPCGARCSLGEVLLRAFVLRRLMLINRQLGNVALIGSRHSADTLRLQEFLGRNGHPYTYVDLDLDDTSRDLLDRFSISVSEIPIVIGNGTMVLRNPSTSQLADCLGLTTTSIKVCFTILSSLAPGRRDWQRPVYGCIGRIGYAPY